MSGPEQKIQKQILDYLKGLGLMAWKNHTQALVVGNGRKIKNPNAGCPDILGYFPNGVGFAIEVKAQGNKPSDDQYNWLANAKSNGVLAFWTNNLGDVATKIQSYLDEYIDIPSDSMET